MVSLGPATPLYQYSNIGIPRSRINGTTVPCRIVFTYIFREVYIYEIALPFLAAHANETT